MIPERVLSDAVHLRQHVHETRSASQRDMHAVSFRPTLALVILGLPASRRGLVNGCVILLQGHELTRSLRGKSAAAAYCNEVQ